MTQPHERREQKTSAYSAYFGQHVPVDTTAGPVTVTLPPSNRVGEVAVRLVAGSNTLTVDGWGSETVDGSAASVMTLAGEARVFGSDGLGHWFTVASAPTEASLRALIQSELHSDVDAYIPLVASVNTVATSGAAQTIPDVSLYQMHDITLTANCTFTFPSNPKGKCFRLVIRQDAVGGRSCVWPANSKRSETFEISSEANSADSIIVFSVRSSMWGLAMEGHKYLAF
jgi:hypothetical protein